MGKKYHNMSEENKKKLKEYQKIIVRLKNMLHKCKRVSKSVLYSTRSFITFLKDEMVF